jgi:hypothetical protein
MGRRGCGRWGGGGGEGGGGVPFWESLLNPSWGAFLKGNLHTSHVTRHTSHANLKTSFQGSLNVQNMLLAAVHAAAAASTNAAAAAGGRPAIIITRRW